MDPIELSDALWNGTATTAEADNHPVTAIDGLGEVTHGVAFVKNLANSAVITTGDGMLVVDTGHSMTAPFIKDAIREWTDEPMMRAVWSHGHVDHVFGVELYEAENADRGLPAPIVHAHEAMPARFERYALTGGYNSVINSRQFGLPVQFPTEFRAPDQLHGASTSFDVNGMQVLCFHDKGETDDHTWTWIPEKKVLCTGDLFIWASPNCGNPQKVQRYPREWAVALRKMAALEPEFLLPGHGWPVIGKERVHAALTDTAAYLESIVEQSLALMNEGARLDDLIHTVAPPSDLADKPYLQPVYDEPEFIVRNIWRLYGGWYDGNPAHLHPPRERDLASELADLAGGAAALAQRALDVADRGDLRLAGALAELAREADPEDATVVEIHADVYTRRTEAASSTMATGVYRWAAGNSGGQHGHGHGHSH